MEFKHEAGLVKWKFRGKKLLYKSFFVGILLKRRVFEHLITILVTSQDKLPFLSKYWPVWSSIKY